MSETLNEKFSVFKTTKSKKLYMKQKWNLQSTDKYLELVITDCMNFWIGTYSKIEVEKNSNLSNFDIGSVKTQFENAFSIKSESDYLIEDSYTNEFLNLKLRKVLEGEIKVEIISLRLKIDEEDTQKVSQIFDYSLEYIEQLEKNLEALKQDNKRLAAERTEAISDLAECIKQKDEIETDLYSKFVCILNEKKKKIRELAQQLGNQI